MSKGIRKERPATLHHSIGFFLLLTLFSKESALSRIAESRFIRQSSKFTKSSWNCCTHRSKRTSSSSSTAERDNALFLLLRLSFSGSLAGRPRRWQIIKLLTEIHLYGLSSQEHYCCDPGVPLCIIRGSKHKLSHFSLFIFLFPIASSDLN